MALLIGGWQSCKHVGVRGQLCQQLSSSRARRTRARYCPSVRRAPWCSCLLSFAQIHGCSGLLLLPSPTWARGKVRLAGVPDLGGMVTPWKPRVGFLKVERPCHRQLPAERMGNVC